MGNEWMPKGKGKDQAKKNKKPAPELPIILAGTKGKLHMSKRLMEQVNLLHDYAGNVEWSGPLFYNITGNLSNPDNIKIVAHAMYPMDIGTSGYTEYDFEPEQTMDMHDYYPEIITDSWDMGHMHTHHNMKAYFSGTDDQELRDNTPNHAYYVSLIVNHKKEYVARLCVMAKKTVTGLSAVSYRGIDEIDSVNKSEIEYEHDVVYAVDLDVTFDDAQLPFMAEVSKIIKRKEKKKEALHKDAMTTRGNKNWTNVKWENAKEVDDWNGSFIPNQMGMMEVPGFDVLSDQARDFAYKLLDCNVNSDGHFLSLVIKMEHQYVGHEDEIEGILGDLMADNFDEIYQYVFEDPQLDGIYDNLLAVSNFLTKYQTTYTIVDFLIQELGMYMHNEIEEEDEIIALNDPFAAEAKELEHE